MTVQGPVKEQRPDGMSHRGAAACCRGLYTSPVVAGEAHADMRVAATRLQNSLRTGGPDLRHWGPCASRPVEYLCPVSKATQ